MQPTREQSGDQVEQLRAQHDIIPRLRATPLHAFLTYAKSGAWSHHMNDLEMVSAVSWKRIVPHGNGSS